MHIFHINTNIFVRVEQKFHQIFWKRLYFYFLFLSLKSNSCIFFRPMLSANINAESARFSWLFLPNIGWNSHMFTNTLPNHCCVGHTASAPEGREERSQFLAYWNCLKLLYISLKISWQHFVWQIWPNALLSKVPFWWWFTRLPPPRLQSPARKCE